MPGILSTISWIVQTPVHLAKLVLILKQQSSLKASLAEAEWEYTKKKLKLSKNNVGSLGRQLLPTPHHKLGDSSSKSWRVYISNKDGIFIAHGHHTLTSCLVFPVFSCALQQDVSRMALDSVGWRNLCCERLSCLCILGYLAASMASSLDDSSTACVATARNEYTLSTLLNVGGGAVKRREGLQNHSSLRTTALQAQSFFQGCTYTHLYAECPFH